MRIALICTASLALAASALAQDTAPASAPTSGPTSAPISASTSAPMAESESPFAAAAEAAHGADAWRAHDAIAMDMTVTFGPRTPVDGHVIYDHHGSRVRIEQADGTVMVFDGDHAWVSPADSETRNARFTLLTYPYFLAAPFKLSDPGASLEDTGEMPIDGEPRPTARLTFGEGVGDAPEDWYIVYRDPETGLVDALAYIVTYFPARDDGEYEAHSIVYHGYEDIDSAMISTSWTFHHWNEEEGPHGDPIASATISNIHFVTPEPGTFDAPEGAREDSLPGS